MTKLFAYLYARPHGRYLGLVEDLPGGPVVAGGRIVMADDEGGEHLSRVCDAARRLTAFELASKP